MRYLSHLFYILSLVMITASCSFFGIRNEEQPNYKVLISENHKEIRLYQPYVIAKTEVEGEFTASQTKAFKILAGYIFGDNIKKQKISMTAPVTQKQSIINEKIAMTAPVTQFKKDGKWVMAFMMPSKYKIEDLPKPNDSRITFEQISSRYVAAITYTWYNSLESFNVKSGILINWLDSQKDFEMVSLPVFAGYDPPWTLPFFRRNEVLIELKKIN